jgi:hypothetical protein
MLFRAALSLLRLKPRPHVHVRAFATAVATLAPRLTSQCMLTTRPGLVTYKYHCLFPANQLRLGYQPFLAAVYPVVRTAGSYVPGHAPSTVGSAPSTRQLQRLTFPFTIRSLAVNAYLVTPVDFSALWSKAIHLHLSGPSITVRRPAACGEGGERQSPRQKQLMSSLVHE